MLLIYLGSLFETRAIVRPEGLNQLKIPMTASGIELLACSSAVPQPTAPLRTPDFGWVERIMQDKLIDSNLYCIVLV
jgi:hypothetical protein